MLEQLGLHLMSLENTLLKTIASVIVIVTLLLVRKALNKFIVSRNLSSSNAYFWHKVVSYSTISLIVLIVGGIWLYGVKNLATFLGLLSAGLAVALREPIVDIVGWLFILAKHPFTLGDRIEIDAMQGDVIDLGPLYFSVMEIGRWVEAEQSTGRIIHIPNNRVFTSSIANYTQQFPYIWDEIPVLVTFESNWEKAKDILMKIIIDHAIIFTEVEEREVRELATRYYIKLGSLTPTVYTSVVDSGVQLTMRYLTPARQRRDKGQKIWDSVLRAFAREDDIDLAYNTQRVFYNPREGKPGAGGPKHPTKTL